MEVQKQKNLLILIDQRNCSKNADFLHDKTMILNLFNKLWGENSFGIKVIGLTMKPGINKEVFQSIQTLVPKGIFKKKITVIFYTIICNNTERMH